MTEPRTLCELFQFALRDRPRQAAYLVKSGGAYRPISSRAFADRVQSVAAGLRQIGVRPGDRIAIWSGNRIEWSVADYAILLCGAITVPIYSTLQPATVHTILANSQASAIFVSSPAQFAKLGEPGDLPQLRDVIVFDAGGDGTAAKAARPARSLSDLESSGAAAPDLAAFEHTWRAVMPLDTATIIYTSGTTGDPKGVVLTHANIVSNVIDSLRQLDIREGDTCLSFLPLTHILERMAGHFLMWHVGATIAFAESVDTVPENLREVRPTVFISVPRLYEKMSGRVHDVMAQESPLRRKLFAWGKAVGHERVRREQAGERVPRSLELQNRIADRLVFRKLRARLGGRLRTIVSGGAPLPTPIAYFFHGAGLPILEGYGLTETSPVVTLTPRERPKIGSVGPPIPNVEVRIDPKTGEIQVRGPNIMQAYYRNEKATAEALDGGWFHTGDVGELDADGYLRITDRIKDLIVTAGGKKVAPQNIESQLKASQYVGEVILIGDQRKYLCALIVPRFQNVESFAKSHGVHAETQSQLASAPEIIHLFENLLGEHNARLAPFERIKRFRLLDRELELAAGEITPSMKVKRTVVAKTFASLIDSMYVEPPPPEVGCPPTSAATGAATSGVVAAATPAPESPR